jgi:hypothetical protein
MGKSSHGFLEGCIGVRAVVVENIHVLKPHSLQGLVTAADQVLATPPLSIRTWPHIVASLAGDDQLIPVRGKVPFQDGTKPLFCTSSRWTIIVRQIKMGNTIVKCSGENAPAYLVVSLCPKIVPESKGELRKA